MELAVANAVIKEKHTYKRFASLDFSRGLAIILMLVLHVIMTVLDINGLFTKVNDLPILNLIALILLPFLGGLAGFFLLVSSVGNMVSMYNDLERGNSIKNIVVKQVVGGFLLLIFAMLCEGVTGYFGLVGNFFSSLNNPLATDWRVMLWR